MTIRYGRSGHLSTAMDSRPPIRSTSSGARWHGSADNENWYYSYGHTPYLRTPLYSPVQCNISPLVSGTITKLSFTRPTVWLLGWFQDTLVPIRTAVQQLDTKSTAGLRTAEEQKSSLACARVSIEYSYRRILANCPEEKHSIPALAVCDIPIRFRST